MFFLDVFINHFPKTCGSVLCEITIDLFHFETFMTSVYEKHLLAQSGNQTVIFWKFYSPTDTLWLPKTVGRMLGYTNVR